MILAKPIKNQILFILAAFISLSAFAQPDGAKIFKQNCTACHVIGETKLIGPGLKGVTEKRNKEWFIKSEKMAAYKIIFIKVILMKLRSN